MKTPLRAGDLQTGVRVVLNTVNQMFCTYFWKSCLSRKCTDQPACLLIEKAVDESTLINVRVFDDFCAGCGTKPDDLLPAHFPGLVLGGGFLLQEDKRAINKNIAHLTHVTLANCAQDYSYDKILMAAIPRVIEFCSYAGGVAVNDGQLAQFAADTLKVVRLIQQDLRSSRG